MVDLLAGLRGAFLARRIFPVVMSSALHNIGSDFILDLIVNVFPAPAARLAIGGTSEPDGKGKPVERKISDAEPVSLFVFKTLSDAFAGRINYFKVVSGVLKNDATLTNLSRGVPERFQHLHIMQGKTATDVAELHAGDIGAIAKLKETITGDTLGDKAAPIFYPPRESPNPRSRLPSSPRRAPTKIALGKASTRFWRKTCRCGFRATRRPRSFCFPGRASSTSKWWWPSCASALRWT